MATIPPKPAQESMRSLPSPKTTLRRLLPECQKRHTTHIPPPRSQRPRAVAQSSVKHPTPFPS
ncbi:hypothetical protein BC829DRAFT_398856 [Chytridium lagenaria]|nr:hypothetical protein BC829DRAFT_398856 [Chytridium lagenaria]